MLAGALVTHVPRPDAWEHGKYKRRAHSMISWYSNGWLASVKCTTCNKYNFTAVRILNRMCQVNGCHYLGTRWINAPQSVALSVSVTRHNPTSRFWGVTQANNYPTCRAGYPSPSVTNSTGGYQPESCLQTPSPNSFYEMGFPGYHGGSRT